ncbi:MAG TPA: hypothetical protein P5123_00880 [Spirochaetota bacterium]|nr:hypothetical protein [Spirochaetota bacterium]
MKNETFVHRGMLLLVRCSLFLIIISFNISVFSQSNASLIVYSQNAAFFADNMDYTSYSEDDYEKYRIDQNDNSDDRSIFYLSKIGIGADYATDRFNCVVRLDKDYLWGGFDKYNSSNSGLSVNTLYAKVTLLPFVFLKTGRFYSSPGGALYDYVFGDTMDGVRLDVVSPLGKIPLFLNLEAEVYAQNGKPAGIYGNLKDDESMPLNDFNGDTSSYRCGIVTGVEPVRVIGNFLRYGASRDSGAQIAENGRSPLNKCDEDYLILTGLRIGTAEKTKVLSWDITGLYSQGRDSRYSDAIMYKGYAVLAAVNMGNKQNDGLNHLFFHTGFYSPWFCGMRSNTPGGVATDQMKGYVYAPVAGYNGFIDNSKRAGDGQGYDLTAPKAYLKTGGRVSLSSFSFRMSYISIFVNESEDIWMRKNPLFTYIGSEGEFELVYSPGVFALSMGISLFKPSEYYEKPNDDLSASGTDILYAFYTKLDYSFRLL